MPRNTSALRNWIDQVIPCDDQLTLLLAPELSTRVAKGETTKPATQQPTLHHTPKGEATTIPSTQPCHHTPTGPVQRRDY